MELYLQVFIVLDAYDYSQVKNQNLYKKQVQECWCKISSIEKQIEKFKNEFLQDFTKRRYAIDMREPIE